MTKPRLVFDIRKKEDLDVALAFRTVKAGGIDFRKWGLLAPHPELRKYTRLTERVLSAYIDRFYLEHAADLERTTENFAQTWRSVARAFFALAKETFGSGFPPPGTYTCYVSIWNCNPRDIDHRSFQIFFRHIHPRETMVHEMLHFAFYAYVYQKYPDLKRADNAHKLWEISEAFNSVFLNDPCWRERLQMKRQPSYPALRGLVRRMRRQWIVNQSLDELLVEFLKIKGSA